MSNKDTDSKITVLNIANVLPYANKRANPIIIENSEDIREYSEDRYQFCYIKPLPYSNFLLSLLKDKWKNYYEYPKNFRYSDNIVIHGIRGLVFPNSFLVQLTSFTFFAFNFARIKSILRDNDVDMVHAHGLFPEGAIAYTINALFSIPFILTVRSGIRRYFDEKSFGLTKVGENICYSAEKLLTLNHPQKSILQKNIDKEITPLPHPICREELWRDFGVSEPVKIITVSHLQKYKNIELVIEALARINNLGYQDSYTYTVVGRDKENLNLDDFAHDLGVEVNFTGELSYADAQDKLKDSDIFVLPSYYETFGKAYIEALAKSNATIAVKDTGVYGYFQENKEILYVDQGDVDSICSKLKLLLDDKDLIQKLKKHGYEAVKNDFTKNTVIGQYIKTFDDVLSAQIAK